MSLNDKTYKFNNNKPNTLVFLEDKISGKIEEKKFNENLFLIKANLNCKDDVLAYSNGTVDGFALSYNLQGQSDAKSRISDVNVKTKNNITNILLTKDENSSIALKKGEHNIVGIILKKDFFNTLLQSDRTKDKLLNLLQRKVCNELLISKSINYQIQLLLNDIINSPFDGELDDLFIQSKVLELIFLEFKSLFINQEELLNNKDIKLDNQDIQSIKQAKDILIQNIQNPPSIMELSKLVALNDFKLKLGFKKIFKTTPHNFLIEYKLTLARKLLIDGDMNINEISKHIGYKHTANFTTAFKKRFGINPKELMKTRKYYY